MSSEVPAALTVGVLCRADEPALERTLRSLAVAAAKLADAGREVRFVVCVNGPSRGPALDAARAFAAQEPRWQTSVVVDGRADKARAWNLVRQSCTTPLIAFSDADVEVAPDALVRLVAALEAEPEVQIASARQVARLDGPGVGAVARAAALPYRFDFQVVGGRLYVMRTAAIERMPEGLLLEDGWLSATLGNEKLRTVADAEVYFHPAGTLPDYFRERLRTEAGKIQIREQRRNAGIPQRPIARYPWRRLADGLRVTDAPLVVLNLAVRLSARAVAELAARRGRRIAWAPIASSKAPRPEVPTS
ncbi:MAG TPA: glycosyltransferase family 2 protein [Candidatus Binatia bacterium]